MSFKNSLHSLHSFYQNTRKINEIEYGVVFVDVKEEKPSIKRVGNSVGNYCIHDSLHFSTYPNMANCLAIILK